MDKLRFSRNLILIQFLVLSPFFSSARADDTEIFFNIELWEYGDSGRGFEF
jgi:hypothetical protein